MNDEVSVRREIQNRLKNTYGINFDISWRDAMEGAVNGFETAQKMGQALRGSSEANASIRNIQKSIVQELKKDFENMTPTLPASLGSEKWREKPYKV